jgi:hypothetical protein
MSAVAASNEHDDGDFPLLIPAGTRMIIATGALAARNDVSPRETESVVRKAS